MNVSLLNEMSVAGAFAALTLCAMPASAQEGPGESARREIIARAERSSDHGDHAEALDLAQRAGQIRMTPSVELLIAQESLAVGQTVTALDFGRRCAREAAGDPALRHRRRIIEGCQRVIQQAEPRVARVTLRLGDAPPAGLSIRVANAEVPAAAWGVAIPVTPGDITIVVRAPNHDDTTRTVHVEPGAELVVPVEPGTFHPPPPPPPPPPPQRVVVAPPVAPVPVVAGGPGVAPWIVVGAGGASLVVSLTFALLASSAVDARDAICDANGAGPCNDRSTAVSHDDDQRTFITGANVTLGLGIAAVAGGVAWYLLAPRRARPATRALNWSIGPLAGGATVTLGGEL